MSMRPSRASHGPNHTGPCCAQTEIVKRAGTTCTGMGGAVYYLTNARSHKEYEVDLENPDCCHYVHTHTLPCRHMLVVFYSRNMLGSKRKVCQCLNRYWPKWALAQEYVRLYEGRSIRAPPVYTGPSTGSAEDNIGIPLQTQKKRGRPKKARYRYKPKTVNDVATRMPTVYNAEFADALHFM